MVPQTSYPRRRASPTRSLAYVVGSLLVHGLLLACGWRWASVAIQREPASAGPEAPISVRLAPASAARPEFSASRRDERPPTEESLPRVAPELGLPDFDQQVEELARQAAPTELLAEIRRADLQSVSAALDPRVRAPRRTHEAGAGATVGSDAGELALTTPTSAPSGKLTAVVPASSSESSEVLEPHAQHAPRPEYPVAALKAMQQGSVVCEIDIDAQGVVVAVRVVRSSGSVLLDEAARDGLMRWRFAPARRAGEPVAWTLRHTVRFRVI